MGVTLGMRVAFYATLPLQTKNNFAKKVRLIKKV